VVEVVRIHDPHRRPANWSDMIGPEQFVAFAKNVDSGAPCDADGRGFADFSAGTCLLFESLDEARRFCLAAVRAAPVVQFDLFDAEGRANSPLLTFVDPTRGEMLDSHPRAQHKRRVIAWALIAAGIALIVYTAWREADVDSIFPGVIGINVLLAGGRLLWLNLAFRETERVRQERLNRLER
jgi:hypothetical protein